MSKLLLTLLLSTTIILLSACSSSDNLEKPSPLVEFKPKITVAKQWSDSLEGTDEQYLNLHIAHAGKTLYVAGYKGDIYAVNASDGDTVWKQNIDAHIVGGVTVAHGFAVVTTEGGFVVALKAKTGTVAWRSSIGNQVLGLASISRQVTVVKTIAGVVIGLDTRTGKQLWQYDGNAPQLVLRASSKPTIDGNNVIVGFADGKISMLNLHSGSLQWQQAIATPEGSFPVQRMVDISASPQIKAGIIYATTFQGNIAALERSNGQVVWNHKLSSYTGLALKGSSLYVTDARSHVWKFEQDNGAVAWRQKALQARVLSAPVLLSNYVVVGDAEGYIHWLRTSDGEFVARQKLDGDAIRTAPVVIGNTMYVLDIDGHLVAYQLVR